jgi:hypothetical protein
VSFRLLPVRRIAALAFSAASACAWAGEVPSPTAESVPAGAAGTGMAPVDAAATPAAPPPAAVESAAPAPAQTAAPAAPAAPAARHDPIRLDPPRASLLPLAQPLWSDLSAAQRRVLEPFESQWNGLPISEKRAWAELASRFPKMKADEQKRVEKRVEEWAALTPEQRRLARANYRLAQQVARENLLAEWENYQSMTPEQRSVLGTAGSTSNTAARHAGASTGLAKQAAQPLPRRAPARPSVTAGTGGVQSPTGTVMPTVGPAGTSRP